MFQRVIKRCGICLGESTLGRRLILAGPNPKKAPLKVPRSRVLWKPRKIGLTSELRRTSDKKLRLSLRRLGTINANSAQANISKTITL